MTWTQDACLFYAVVYSENVDSNTVVDGSDRGSGFKDVGPDSPSDKAASNSSGPAHCDEPDHVIGEQIGSPF